MHPGDKTDLLRPLTDASRKVRFHGPSALVPHKFTDDGEVVTAETFTPKKDISKLNLNDLKFLKLWRDCDWKDEDIKKKLNLTDDQARKTFKKLQYFKTEDAKIRALASEATPERVLAKDMENLNTGDLTDSQHKSLDRVAKITGAFKTAGEGGNTINIFNMPRLTPEAERAIRQIADKEADVIEGQIAE